MSQSLVAFDMVSDVKCYYCGHVSGQVITSTLEGRRVHRFVARPGYANGQTSGGGKLRCQRCSGPVFLEDATPQARSETTIALGLSGETKGRPKAA